MNKRFLAISLLVLSCSGWQTRAQQASIGSGTSSSLTPSASGSNAGIGNIFSPNLYNGTANVSVPIYGYGTDNGEFGVSLSYNTGGVKVSERSGPIGLHWSLNAGGGISRILKDMPDEMNTYDDHPLGGGDCLESAFCMGVKGRFAVFMGDNAQYNETERHVDMESDDFVVSVGNLNFTFNIGANGFVFTHPHRNVKVDLLLNGTVATQFPALFGRDNIGSNSDISFRITDEQGAQYFFESKIKDKKGYVSSLNPDAEVFSIRYVSQWNIQKVILSDGNEIVYNYEEGVGEREAPLYMAFQSSEKPVGWYDLSMQEIKAGPTKRLATINYPNNVQVTFTYDNTVPRCDNLKNSNGYYAVTGSLVKEIKVAEFNNCLRYQLQHVYSVAPNNNSNAPLEIAWGDPCALLGDTAYAYHRVVLKGIRKLSCDSNSVEPYYSFEYDAQRLPWRYSGAQDYFGYYNGQNGSLYGMMTIPLHTPLSGAAYGIVKDHNVAYATAGILRTVKNAYGGEVHFDYQGHELSNVLSGLPTTDPLFMGINANDGVRIKDITIKDRHYPGSYLKQEFSYSGGQRFLTGGYFHTPMTNGISSRMFSGIYVSPHQMVNGSNHGYTQVVVTSKDQSGNQFSRVLTEYTNFLDPVTGQPRYELNGGSKHYYELPFADRQYIRDWELGLPIKEETYDQGNSITSRVVNEYSFTIDKFSTVGKVENQKRVWYVNSDIEVASEAYLPYTGKSFLTKTTSYKFIDNTNYVKDEVAYQYDGHDNLSRTITTNSRGEQIVSRNVYNYDVSGPGVVGGGQTSSALYAMTAAGIEKHVSKETWKLGGGTAPFNDVLLQASITGFTYDNQKIRTKRLHMLDAGNPVPYSTYTGINPGSGPANPFSKIIATYASNSPVADFELVSEVQSFDAKGNPKETWLPEQDAYKSMIWDEVTGKQLAEANCRYSDMAYAGFETTTKGNWSYDEAKVVGPGVIPGTPISGKRAIKLGNSATPGLTKSGLTPGKEYMVSFWSMVGLPQVIPGGGTQLQLEQTSSISPGGGWSYYQARFIAGSSGTLSIFRTGPGAYFSYLDDVRIMPYDAQMQSWNYEDMTGASSVADANGRITYFEYDKLGRQVLVRDQQRNIISKTEYHIGQ